MALRQSIFLGDVSYFKRPYSRKGNGDVSSNSGSMKRHQKTGTSLENSQEWPTIMTVSVSVCARPLKPPILKCVGVHCGKGIICGLEHSDPPQVLLDLAADCAPYTKHDPNDQTDSVPVLSIPRPVLAVMLTIFHDKSGWARLGSKGLWQVILACRRSQLTVSKNVNEL